MNETQASAALVLTVDSLVVMAAPIQVEVVGPVQVTVDQTI